MVLRVETIRAKLFHLEQVVAELANLAKRPRERFAESLEERWAVERGLQLGAELVFDIGQHILSARFGIIPKDYEAITPHLAERGVLPQELAARLRGLGGFRNLLVHEYALLDSARVLENLSKAPADLGEFVLAVRGWVDAQSD
jgi:uncharacterized protein YutE (UPF0331/DUF86 family)